MTKYGFIFPLFSKMSSHKSEESVNKYHILTGRRFCAAAKRTSSFLTPLKVLEEPKEQNILFLDVKLSP